jgi:hypothetical protein
VRERHYSAFSVVMNLAKLCGFDPRPARRLGPRDATGVGFARYGAMPASSFDADRIACLKRLHVQWTTELQHLNGVERERAFHLAEAIQDLNTVISNLEALCPVPPPIGSVVTVRCPDPG